MNLLDLVLKILTMAVVTYLIRLLPLALIRKKITSPFVLSFLYYIPYAVLTAMTFPAILHETQHLASAVAGLAVGSFLALRGRSLLTVAIGTSAGALAVELLLSIFST